MSKTEETEEKRKEKREKFHILMKEIEKKKNIHSLLWPINDLNTHTQNKKQNKTVIPKYCGVPQNVLATLTVSSTRARPKSAIYWVNLELFSLKSIKVKGSLLYPFPFQYQKNQLHLNHSIVIFIREQYIFWLRFFFVGKDFNAKKKVKRENGDREKSWNETEKKKKADTLRSLWMILCWWRYNTVEIKLKPKRFASLSI